MFSLNIVNICHSSYSSHYLGKISALSHTLVKAQFMYHRTDTTVPILTLEQSQLKFNFFHSLIWMRFIAILHYFITA